MRKKKSTMAQGPAFEVAAHFVNLERRFEVFSCVQNLPLKHESIQKRSMKIIIANKIAASFSPCELFAEHFIMLVN